jgi:hypothetical protein
MKRTYIFNARSYFDDFYEQKISITLTDGAILEERWVDEDGNIALKTISDDSVVNFTVTREFLKYFGIWEEDYDNTT